MQDIGRWVSRGSPRGSRSDVFLCGSEALLIDTVGFAVLATIQIQVIQKLALVASIGVAALIITNLVAPARDTCLHRGVARRGRTVSCQGTRR